MADLVFAHNINDAPHIRLSEDGPLNGPFSLLPNSIDLKSLMTNAAGYSFPFDTHHLPHDTIAARTSYMDTRLSYVEKSANGCSPILATNKSVKFHPLSISPTQESDGEPDTFSGLSWRYESPSGSCGDQTDADSSFSEQSWSHVNICGDPQGTTTYSPFSSPLNGTLQYRDTNCFLSTNVEGSYCGSEHSVSLREVQHYPDPDPEAEPKFEIGVGLDGRSFTFHQSLPTRDSFSGVIESSQLDTGKQDTGELSNDVDTYVESPMAKINLGPIPTVEQDVVPRKKMKYSVSTPLSIPPSPKSKSSQSSGAPSSARSRAAANRPANHGHKMKPSQSIRGPYSSRSQQKTSDRQFICVFAPYGCHSTFTAKNEWKRHVSSQHLQLGFYRCDVGCCNVPSPLPSSSNIPVQSSQPLRSPNDFNRKDLFTQHQRRMHSPWASSNGDRPSKQEQDTFDKSLEKVRKRCWIERRKAPRRSVCNFCSREFSGTYCWDDRMEHVGKHYEKRDVETCEDVALKEWAIQEGVVKEAGKDKWVLASPKEAAERRAEDLQCIM
ncbi:hypothetical protein AJ78_05896 [Emergomyces pasteurianus Ep9510]|uniref:C2H2-type domain-containing protein n=1 Tax=Emergomyces pasteurianus Ep9510 TaxID=1447872 RepID=A0A1J9QCK0_9EURO|nr:hypothetical protein AJ78_05896 [Emergomyces pasteurianus Ep9510]